MDKISWTILGFVFGIWTMLMVLVLNPREPEVKYIYDDEARLVGFCNGKYLIREEEDEFPSGSGNDAGTGCMFIEPIYWEG